MIDSIGKANFKLDLNDKYKVVLIRKVSGVYCEVKRQNIKVHQKEVSYRGGRFPFDIGNPTVRRKNTYLYYVDIKKGQINFEQEGKNATEVTPEMMEKIIYESVVGQMVSGLEKVKMGPVIVYVILTAGMCLALGYIIGSQLVGG